MRSHTLAPTSICDLLPNGNTLLLPINVLNYYYFISEKEEAIFNPACRSVCLLSVIRDHCFLNRHGELYQTLQGPPINDVMPESSSGLSNRVFSRPVAWPVVTMETVGQTNQRTVTAGAQALSAHYIMLIRPLQALPLVRIYRKLFIFKYIF